MSRTSILLFTVALLIAAHDLPAPIVEEEKPTPAPEQSEAPKPPTKSAATSEEQAPAKSETRAKPASPSTSQGRARSAPGKQKSVEASGSNSAWRFDGIWQGSRTINRPEANYIRKFTLTVRGKSVEVTEDTTITPSDPKRRPLSRIHIKAMFPSDHVGTVGSDLIVRWRRGQVVDWEPKTFTRKQAEEIAGVENSGGSNVFTLKGNELVAAGGTIYHRVK